MWIAAHSNVEFAALRAQDALPPDNPELGERDERDEVAGLHLGHILGNVDQPIGRAQAGCAKKGDASAQTLVGLIYEGSYGVPSNLKEAANWYGLAAEAGNRDAQFALGKMYLDGRGVSADKARAADYFEKAAERGHVQAMYNLGLLFLNGAGRPKELDSRGLALCERGGCRKFRSPI